MLSLGNEVLPNSSQTKSGDILRPSQTSTILRNFQTGASGSASGYKEGYVFVGISCLFVKSQDYTKTT